MSETRDPRTLTSGLLTIEQAAAWMGISRAQFFKLKIRRIEVGGPQTVRIDIRDLQAWADANGDVKPMRKTG